MSRPVDVPVAHPPPARVAGHPVVDAYVRLGLRLDRVVPGVLDAHLGDPALARAVDDEPPPDPAALVRDADALRAELPGSGLAAPRRAYLDAQLVACRALAARAGGQPARFTAEVAACYGVDVVPGDPDRYRAAHRALDALLPGRGSLRRRLAAFRARDRVPPDQLGVAARALLAALRERTAATVGLPPHESVRVEVVDDAPWSGFSRRTGPSASTVAVNAASGHAGHRAPHLALLVAHEAYPGHHTEHVRLERAADPGERSILLARTPQSLVAEGAAELGLGVVVGPGWGRWTADVLAGAGIAGFAGDGAAERAAVGEAVEDVMGELAGVRQDAALLLHEHGAPPADVARHLRRWLLVDADRAQRMVGFLAHPRWRTHTTTYVEGVPLVSAWLAARGPGESAPARYARLYDEPWTTATLRTVNGS